MRSAICLSISVCVYVCVCVHRKKRRIVNIYKRLNNFGLAACASANEPRTRASLQGKYLCK